MTDPRKVHIKKIGKKKKTKLDEQETQDEWDKNQAGKLFLMYELFLPVLRKE